ncbi:MAG: hypothetical protein HXX08_11155 [Chloroflexi bacterium]|uniref:PARP-type domain-containing protein n=1 Tax=Candidatus Chlorohelix allophototropha TaxID=3003348 RepID=A0A8T7M3D1_9CHLR|nr:hypothetical protein [Chloroflexota bacterium]WJW65794.1 hypothetical protein OZ401_001573 [Chloroflexota bacterium L227-S17]
MKATFPSTHWGLAGDPNNIKFGGKATQFLKHDGYLIEIHRAVRRSHTCARCKGEISMDTRDLHLYVMRGFTSQVETTGMVKSRYHLDCSPWKVEFRNA